MHNESVVNQGLQEVPFGKDRNENAEALLKQGIDRRKPVDFKAKQYNQFSNL